MSQGSGRQVTVETREIGQDNLNENTATGVRGPSDWWKFSQLLTADAIQRLGLFAALVVIGLSITYLSDVFLSVSNFANIGRAISVIGVVCIGQTIVLLTENIDLSVGSVAALAGVALASTQQYGVAASVTVALVVGAFVGLFHGLVRIWTGVNALIITLATMTGLRGLVLVATEGHPIGIESDTLNRVLWADLGVFPVPLLILLGLLIIASLVLNRTRFGTYVYAIGGNKSAAEKAGISSSRYVVLAFVISGLLAAVAGVMIAARLGTVSPTAGTGWELQSIAAVVIGGASLAGGRGDMVGTFLGVILIGVISNGMNLLRVDAFYQLVVLGLLILAAVITSAFQERRGRH